MTSNAPRALSLVPALPCVDLAGLTCPVTPLPLDTANMVAWAIEHAHHDEVAHALILYGLCETLGTSAYAHLRPRLTDVAQAMRTILARTHPDAQPVEPLRQQPAQRPGLRSV